MTYVSAGEAADILKISAAWFRRLLAAGRVRGAKKIGPRLWLVPVGKGGKPRVSPPATRNMGPKRNRWRR